MYGGFTDSLLQVSTLYSRVAYKTRVGGCSTTYTLLAFYTNKTKAASTEINLWSLIHVLGLNET